MNRLNLWSEYILKKDNLYKLNYSCIYKNPCLEKIIINLNIKNASSDYKQILPGFIGLELITHQKPVVYHAKKSIAVFKLRKNSIIGCKLTLQKKKLFDTLDLLISIVLAKTQGFQGFKELESESINQVNIGLTDISIFQQINENQNHFLKKLGCNFTFFIKSNNNMIKNLTLNQYQIPKRMN